MISGINDIMARERTQYDFSHLKLTETCFVLYGQFCYIFYVFENNMHYSVTNFLVTKVIEIFHFLTDYYFVCSMSLYELD